MGYVSSKICAESDFTFTGLKIGEDPPLPKEVLEEPKMIARMLPQIVLVSEMTVVVTDMIVLVLEMAVLTGRCSSQIQLIRVAYDYLTCFLYPRS